MGLTGTQGYYYDIDTAGSASHNGLSMRFSPVLSLLGGLLLSSAGEVRIED